MFVWWNFQKKSKKKNTFPSNQKGGTPGLLRILWMIRIWAFPMTLCIQICQKRNPAWNILLDLNYSENTLSCYALTCIIFFKLKLNSSFDIFYWLLEPLIFFKTEFKRKKKNCHKKHITSIFQHLTFWSKFQHKVQVRKIQH